MIFCQGKCMMDQCCGRCANVMESETAGTGLRCGWPYYKLSPKARKMQRLDVFEPVEATACCGNYREPGLQGLLFATSADGLMGSRA
jgi:hypothetical protein